MVTTLIVTHGGLAQELLQAAETIVGKLDTFEVVTLDWSDSFEEALQKTQLVMDELDDDQEVLILTDMYGGTPYNVAASLIDPGRVELVTGVNLPMVVRLGCPDTRDKGVAELAEWIQAKARTSICRAGERNGNGKESRQEKPASDEPVSCDD